MIHLITFVGNRPQIIKSAAISRCIDSLFGNRIRETLVHSGQHYDESMSASFFNELQIAPEKYNLNTGSLSHAQQTAHIMNNFEKVLLQEQPNAVLVYGDTNSTLAASLTASKLHIPVIHIEAGLRSFNKEMPEEINRICCDHVSTLLFSPTETALRNLKREGFGLKTKTRADINNPAVFQCGDIMLDNSIYYKSKAEHESTILRDHGLLQNGFALVTIHRDSNTDSAKNLKNIFTGILELAEEHDIKFIIPLHPRTKKMMKELLSQSFINKIELNSQVLITGPASFLDMIMLEAHSRIILTDSGGVQKESYFFNKPCIILRNETEWLELVKYGTAKICGANKTKIKNAFSHFIGNPPASFPPVFGDGRAAEFILDSILKHLPVHS